VVADVTVIEVSDRAVGYDIVGTGPAVVLCHSLGGDRTLWAAQSRALADTHTVVAYDLRGHGETGLGEREPTLDVLAEDLCELVDALGLGPVHFVGQSIGAMTLLAFAAAYPERESTYAVLDGVARSNDEWDARYRARADRVEAHGLGDEALQLAELSLGETTRARDPGFAARYAQRLAAAPRAGYAWACRAMIGFDLRARLRAVAQPMLVAAGSEDVLTTPAHAREIAAAVPTAELAEIPRSGHVPCLEAPEALNDLLRAWIARHS
jgi:pimeloyl-ACP methyl ester carboxylesterase